MSEPRTDLQHAMAIQTGAPIAGEQPGFDCDSCGHRHQGERFAFICIGCMCPVRAEPRTTAPDPSVPPASTGEQTERCAICGWPLAESIEKGCMRGNCSMRPFPAHFYDPTRAKVEYHGWLDNDPRVTPPPPAPAPAQGSTSALGGRIEQLRQIALRAIEGWSDMDEWQLDAEERTKLRNELAATLASDPPFVSPPQRQE